MDNVKSTKLTAMISKLTVAANKAIKKTHTLQDTRKHYSKTDFNAPLRLNQFEQNMRTAKLLK